MFRRIVYSLLPVLFLVISGCQTGANVTETAVLATSAIAANPATTTPSPTNTPEPTATPTNTPEPTETATPKPTDTPQPTSTAAPIKPTRASTPGTERPTDTPDRETAVPTSRPLTDSNVDAIAVLEKAQFQMQQLETMNMWASMLIELTEGVTEIEMDCDMETETENTYCLAQMTVIVEGEAMGLDFQFETVQWDGETWMRFDGNSAWMPAPADDNSLFSPNQMTLDELEPYLQNAEIVGETEIADVSVYEILLDMDMQAFMEGFLGEELDDAAPAELDVFFMSIRYWIGQEDYLTRKALIEMNMEIEGEALRLTMQMAFSDFDEPVKIPDPTVLEMDA